MPPTPAPSRCPRRRKSELSDSDHITSPPTQDLSKHFKSVPSALKTKFEMLKAFSELPGVSGLGGGYVPLSPSLHLTVAVSGSNALLLTHTLFQVSA